MNEKNQNNQTEPFFVTEEIESKMVARGYTFDPPNYSRTISLSKVLAGLSDGELERWPGNLTEDERKNRLYRPK